MNGSAGRTSALVFGASGRRGASRRGGRRRFQCRHAAHGFLAAAADPIRSDRRAPLTIQCRRVCVLHLCSYSCVLFCSVMCTASHSSRTVQNNNNKSDQTSCETTTAQRSTRALHVAPSRLGARRLVSRLIHSFMIHFTALRGGRCHYCVVVSLVRLPLCSVLFTLFVQLFSAAAAVVLPFASSVWLKFQMSVQRREQRAMRCTSLVLVLKSILLNSTQ